MNSKPEELEPLKNSVMLASEYLLPGGSNLIEGELVQGGIHAVLGLVAKAVFGLPGLIAVSANSFTKATTGRHLYEYLGLGIGQGKGQASRHDAGGDVKAYDTPRPALATQSHPASETGVTAGYSSRPVVPLPQKRQSSTGKRQPSSKTNKNT
jgi:Family of unknown function (DUF6072)